MVQNNFEEADYFYLPQGADFYLMNAGEHLATENWQIVIIDTDRLLTNLQEN